ncbi:MAG: hypothetical protein HOP09_08545 [Hyphomicrobium sp.]|nr:hypothetical protein [Hyphomicrobium sp.]
MSMFVLFAVREAMFQSVDDVAQRVAALVDAKPMNRMGDEKGGYCTFQSSTGEHIEVVAGVWSDEDGDYPREPDFPNWPYLLYLNNTHAQSAWLKALEGDGAQFKKMRTDVVSS